MRRYRGKIPKGLSFAFHDLSTITQRFFFFADSPIVKTLLAWLPPVPIAEQSMDVDSTSMTPKPTVAEPVSEAEIYIRLLMLHHLLTSPTNYARGTRTRNRRKNAGSQSSEHGSNRCESVVRSGKNIRTQRRTCRRTIVSALSLFFVSREFNSWAPIDISWLLNVLHRFATMTTHKHPSLTASCATTSTIASTTKQTNS
jgi:hypothetical protein